MRVQFKIHPAPAVYPINFRWCALLLSLSIAILPAQSVENATYPRLGLTVDAKDTIVDVEAGMVAARAGIKIGDHIVSIEGQNLSTIKPAQRANLLQGKSGTVAHMVLLRNKQNYSVAVQRHLPSELSVIDAPKFFQNAPQSDRDFVKVEKPNAFTDRALAQIYHGLSLLPDSVKSDLKHAGIYILLTEHTSTIDDREGGAYFSPRDMRIVMHQPNTGDFHRYQITTLHELGHAYDAVHSYPSRQDAYLAHYNLEASNCPPEARVPLEYFLQSGRPGARECFASLFARKYYSLPDNRLELLEKSFPQTYKYVQSLP